jgi:hypothetical protein
MKRYLLIAFLIISSTSVVLAQTSTATLQGTVKDATGATVAGATLTARNVDTDQSRTAVSGQDGVYRFENLPVGNYQLRAEQSGFKTVVRTGLTFTVAQQAIIDITLEVGAVSQEVSVEGEAPTVNTANATLGNVVNEQQVTSLPLNGRNYVQLALLQSGITEQKNRIQDATANLASQGTFYSSNGAPTRSNRYLLDGTNLSEYGFATASSITGSTLGVEGIREFKILSNSFDAQYGMSMGSQMLVVSKSGTNSFHGDAFDFLRNSALDARNFFDTPASAGTAADGSQRRLPPFRRNNYGGAFGGPIKKDKLFFYTVYEGISQDQGLTRITNTIPGSCRAAAGAVIWNGQGTPPASYASICAQLGANPLGAGTNSVTVSPLVAPWLSLTPPAGLAAIFPLPNLNATQTSWSYGSIASENYGQERVDYTLTSKDNLFGRYTVDDSNIGLPQSQPGFPTFPTSRGQWTTIGENHIFSTNLLNQFTFGYSRSTLHLGGPAYYNGPGYSYIPSGPPDESGPNGFEQGGLTITNVATSAPGGLYVSVGKQTIFSYGDDLYYTHGRHAFKFGALFNRYQIEAVNGTSTTGGLSFLSLGNFLDGLASSVSYYTPGFDDRKDVRYWTLGFYAQDDWRATSKLTINLGIRYEPNTNMIVLHGKGTAIANTLFDAQPTTGNLMMQDPSWRNWSPRVGFAYDPFGTGKTAIRGGVSYLQNVSTWIGFLHLSIKELPQENPIVLNASPSAAGQGIAFTMPFTLATNLPLTSRNPTTYQYFSDSPQDSQPRGVYYNFSIQQQLPWNMAATVAYVGSRNWGLITYTQGNPTFPTGVPGVNGGGQEVCVPPGANSLLPVAQQIYTDGSANTCWQSADTWKNPNWGNITELQATGQSWYNSLQASLDKRVTSGLQFQAALTWSRIFDTTESQSSADAGSATSTNQLDPLHPEGDRSPATFDVPITFRFNALYHIPAVRSNRFVEALANGWMVSPIFQAQSGSVFDLGLGQVRSLPIGVGGGGSPDRPDVYPGRTAYNITHGTSAGCGTGANAVLPGALLGTPNLYYDPCAFYVQPRGFYGNMQRDSLRGPNFMTWDLSITKTNKIKYLGEAGAMEIRVEGFNIFNRANFGTPSRSVYNTSGLVTADTTLTPSANAGAITQTLSTSRQMQLALKLIF